MQEHRRQPGSADGGGRPSLNREGGGNYLTLPEVFSQGSRLLKLNPQPGALRVAITGSATIDLIARAVAVACSQEVFAACFNLSPYGAWQQEALDPSSSLRRFSPDVVVLATDWRDCVTPLPIDASPERVHEAVSAKVASFRAIWAALSHRSGVRIVQHLPCSPRTRFTGVAEERIPASPSRQIAAVRAALLDAGPDVTFLDPEPLGSDPRAWYGAKLQVPAERASALRVARARSFAISNRPGQKGSRAGPRQYVMGRRHRG